MIVEWYQLVLLGIGSCMLGSTATFFAICLCIAAKCSPDPMIDTGVPRAEGND